MISYELQSELSEEEIHDAILTAYPSTSVKLVRKDAVDGTNSSGTKEDTEKSSDIEIVELQRNQVHALQTIKALQEQQQKLFNEFATLRTKYDELKATQASVLWDATAAYHPDLKHIPLEDQGMIENDSVVGAYTVGELLGEGQYATVKACTMESSSKEMALKIIKKDRIVGFNAVRRISNEVATLKKLRKNKHVVHITDVMHSAKNLYIVTEVGGSDLFDFFDEHPEGVQESWAKDIVFRILLAVDSCHSAMICHLDLKPENILLQFDYDEQRCTEVKLCDFGLCAEIEEGATLTSFCGSPGFFAPEMVTQGEYSGQHADMWSVGCLLLEMVMGHEAFCDIWMASYDYETLQEPDKFKDCITTTVEELPAHLHFSTALNEFIVRLLTIDYKHRLTADKAMRHEWFEDIVPVLRDSSGSGSGSVGESDDGAVFPSTLRSAPHPGSELTIITPRSEEKMRLSSNMSDRERKMVSDYNQQRVMKKKNSGDIDPDSDIALPPIEPQTPNIGRAKKILNQGFTLAQRAEKGFPRGPESPLNLRSASNSIDETSTVSH